MIFFKLIVTNLFRHRVRTWISIAGIAFSVAAMLTVVTILQGAVGMFAGLLSTDSEVIVFERNVSDLFFSSVPGAAVQDIQHWSSVDHANPVLFGVVSSEDHPIITCFGVTAADARIHDATWLSGERAAFGRNLNEVALGERAAEFLNASVGSVVTIGHGSFRVMGLVRTQNGFEDGGVFMPLAAAQTFFHKPDSSSVLTVKLKDRRDQAAFKAAIKQRYPGLIALEDSEFNRSYSQFRILKATAWAVGGCGVLLGGLGVANTMIMSVFTRIREIAILRVNGFSRVQIAGIIFGESAVVSLVGALLGLGLGGSAIVALKLIPALHGYVNAQVQPSVVAAVVLLACLTGIAGALYPAAYATRIRAVEALRFE
uniref:Macrolide export ATP-binding/permease protein MacB n=1 Tax=mine drainage metagenome TaxID=410659 RepID=E6PXD1_9ZZZZ